MDVTKIKGLVAGIALALTAAVGTAQAATLSILPEGVTTVEVTAPIDTLGLGGAPAGLATVGFNAAGNPVFGFGITGGSVDSNTGAALIEHDGGGVTLFAAADPTISAEVGNFLIDTAQGAVFGNVNGGTASVKLFNLDLTTTGGIGLDISDELSGAITSVFGAPATAGLQFGLAKTAPQVAPIPLPAGAPLMLAGLAAFGLMRRRQKTA